MNVSVTHWTDEVQAVIADLERLNRSTEADFLAIPAKLTAFLSAARTITTESRAITESISGESGSMTCDALRAVLKNAGSTANHATVASDLEQVRDSLSQIRHSLRGFETIGPSIRAMATLAQIETARLGTVGVDLSHLAADFRASGENIRGRVEYVIEAASTLEARIEVALKEATELEERYTRSLPKLVNIAHDTLTEFRGRQDESGRAATRLIQESDVLGKAIGDIVASVQFHDITRQQVEHVIDSLKRVYADAIRADEPQPVSAKDAGIIELQLAQLTNASLSFAEAVHHMKERLEAVAVQANAMVGEGGSLIGRDDDPGSSFFHRMESCFHAISDSLSGSTTLVEGARRALVDLQTALKSFEKSNAEVHAVERRLRMLAFNTAISSHHIGVAGGPLGVVATSMLRLLADCESSSSEVDSTIASITGSMQDAIARSGPSDNTGGIPLREQLRTNMRELHALNDRTVERTREIASIASGLSADVEQLCNGMSAEALFVGTTEKCCRVLRDILAQIHSDGPQIADDTLRKVEQQYTMNVEREIHESVLSSSGSQVGPVPATDATFGDNVEFF